MLIYIAADMLILYDWEGPSFPHQWTFAWQGGFDFNAECINHEGVKSFAWNFSKIKCVFVSNKESAEKFRFKSLDLKIF